MRVPAWMLLVPLLLLLAAVLMSLPVESAQPPQKTGKSARTELLVVEIHADWCPRCKRVTPVFRELEKEFADRRRIRFEILDVTTKQSKTAAAARANALGIGEWYEKNRSKTSTVAVFKLPERKLLHTFANQANKPMYVDAIQSSYLLL